ncbi:3-oxoacyl-ACP synthase [Streptomyces sp. MUM 203J]|uniref:beta-ketoacyl synthase N-terminal-like domain-containing protein n=1 Tax=Streptomyces sp. MUM 203J TaxID=2791990 RepID=UPI001F04D991|nr:beta-ketoacyl synthase N-terminal-like domain-containing protein [Streptomyces sp. MUM 203J]MCH0542537.1 3-oxoacyl-ACP synthase [Streptomyces sp. MUM 203J]
MRVHVPDGVRRPTDVAVTGIGLVTPAGPDTETSWDGLLDGRSTAARDELLAGLPVDFSCRVSGFGAAGADRALRMGVAAARQAVADAGLTAGGALWAGARVAVVVGHSGGGGGDGLADVIGTALGASGPAFVTSAGCASGATALGVARDLLRAGACDVAVAGGSESARERAAVAAYGSGAAGGALSSRGHDPAGASRPFDADRDGFVLGEAAGVLVLERCADARARRAPVRAVLAGYGASARPQGGGGPDLEGRGVERALRAALADAGLGPEDVDHVNAHGSGVPLEDLVEARVLRRVFGWTPPPVTAVKSVIGHSVGGAGAVEAVCTVLTLRDQAIPPTANLDRLDPEIELDVVTKSPRRRPVGAALSTVCALRGQNAVLAFRTP